MSFHLSNILKKTNEYEKEWAIEGRRKSDHPIAYKDERSGYEGEMSNPDSIAKANWMIGYFNPKHPHRQVLIDILKQNPVKSVLEVGCGAGANLYLIKKNFPEIKIAGCDINADAISVAQEIFARDFPNAAPKSTKIYEEHPRRKFQKEIIGGVMYRDIPLPDVEFRVGKADSIPFNGDSFDLVITDALLFYIAPDKIDRIMREIRRVGYNKFIFVECHSKLALQRIKEKIQQGLNIYNYEELLSKHNFKYISFFKINQNLWGEPLWYNLGYYITCIR